MTIEFHQPTPAEIQAYGLEARMLRAEALRSSSKAVVAFVKSVARRAVDAFKRPVHA